MLASASSTINSFRTNESRRIFSSGRSFGRSRLNKRYSKMRSIFVALSMIFEKYSWASGYPIPDPNPKFFSIPNPYPIFFQNLRVFRVSGISENKAFSPNSSVIPFLATSIIFISNQLDCKGQNNKAAQTSAPHRLQCSEVPSLPQSQY